MIPFCPACIVFTFVLLGFGIVLTLEQMLMAFIPLSILSVWLLPKIYKKLRARCAKGKCLL